MALNICTRILRRKELIKFGLHNVKYVTLIKNPQTSFATLEDQPGVSVHLPKFIKFYSVKALEQNDCDYRNDNNITIVGEDVPSPYTNIETCDFPDYIKEFLSAQGFTKPTIIQAQAWPIALQNKNFVGIAQTGTGKTLAFLLPAVVHIKEKASRKGKGPVVLVLAPTRELARQIEAVAKDFERLLRIRCVCVYGGANRARQMAQLQAGVDIVIATPGRLNDFLTCKETSLGRCSYVVLDEADRMLDMGFEPQIRQILEEVPLERQMMMFSATWPKEVRHLAKDFLGEYVQVNVGSTELSANHNIKQHVYICDTENKLQTFNKIMHDLSGTSEFSKVLVFANTKKVVDFLTFNLKRNGWSAVGIHGDKTQMQRDIVIHKFKNGTTNILVATDVAARGLDVDGVSHVINYDFPNTSEDYIHRIGRTGRQGNKGESHTLLTEDDGRLADTLIAVMKEAKQEIPQELIDLAENYDQAKSEERQVRYQSRMHNRGYNPNRSWNSNNWNTNKNYNSKYNTNKNWNSNNRYGSRDNYNKRSLKDDYDY